MKLHISPELAELDTLARALRLTPMQRRFADLVAVSTEAPGQMQLCARKAGATRKAAPTTATRWSKTDKIIRYIGLARALVQRRAAREGTPAPLVANSYTLQSLATLEETMLTLTAQMRARLGDYLLPNGDIDMEAVRKAPPGVVTGLQEMPQGGIRIRVVSGLQAASRLLDYFQDLPTQAPGDHRKYHGLFSPALPPEVILLLDQARAIMAKSAGGGSTKE